MYFNLGNGKQGVQTKKDLTTEGGSDRSTSRTILRRSAFSLNGVMGCSPLNNLQRNCKKTYTADASDRTKFLKLKAINKTYNDNSFGGDQNNGSYLAIKRVRH